MNQNEIKSVEDLSKMTLEELFAAPGCTQCTHTCNSATRVAAEE
ncbi:hypothetical protein P9159_21560 [Bacillus cereus]|nr:hypothetical protein [Bacillus cereus]